MIRDNSDASWENWGRENPYYGVLTDDKFRQENLDEQRKAEFLETGRFHVNRVLAMVEQRCATQLSRRSALDFGCGVGRLVLPLAEVFTHVTGVDVSPAMLRVAEQNCSERGIHNVEFKRSDDELTQVARKFDFIHSYLVFQHIPVRRGEKILSRLIGRLNGEGVLAVHLPFLWKDSIPRKALHIIRRNFSPFSGLVNIAKGRRWGEPFIQMNMYDMNRILHLLVAHGIRDVYLEVMDVGGFVSAFVIASKPEHPTELIQGKHLWATELKG